MCMFELWGKITVTADLIVFKQHILEFDQATQNIFS